MWPDEPPVPARVTFQRNRGGFLVGATWPHAREWPHRLTRFYVGFWVLSIRTDRLGVAKSREQA